MIAKAADRTARKPRPRTRTLLKAVPDETAQALCRENQQLQRLLQLKEHLTSMALRGEDALAIAAELSSQTGNDVRVLDSLLREVPAPEESQTIARKGMAWAPSQRSVRLALTRMVEGVGATRPGVLQSRKGGNDCTVAPIVWNEITLGYFAIVQALPNDQLVPLDDIQVQDLTNYGAVACGLSLGTDYVRRQILDEARDGLFSRLLHDDLGPSKAASHAQGLALDASLSHRLLVAVPLASTGHGKRQPLENVVRRRILDVTRIVFQEVCPSVALLSRDDHLVALVPESGATAGDVGRQVLERVKKLFNNVDVSVGASGLCTNPAELRRGYSEALKACQVGLTFANLRQDSVLHFEQVGLYGLLAKISSPGELTAFVDGVLGALINYDRTRKPTLTATVKAFLANHGSLVRTCQDLRIQPSTLTYRIQRIKNIGGLDLYSTDDVLLAQAALLIRDGGVTPLAHASLNAD